MSQEGPTIIPEHTKVIPEKKICRGCVYFIQEMTCHRLMGPNEYQTGCQHPSVLLFKDSPRTICRGTFVNDTTPSWCPYNAPVE